MCKKLLCLLTLSLLLTGCSVDKQGMHLDTPENESAMNIRSGADYVSEPEVITDEVVSEIYKVDFYSAKTVTLDETTTDYTGTMFEDASKKVLTQNCIKELINYFDNAGINYEEGFIKNISTYTEYMVSVIVSVGEYDYTCVLAVTEDLEAGQAKFVIEKEVIDADKSS